MSKNKFEVVNGNIYILRKEWSQIAQTTYREDYYDELKSVTWGIKSGYIYNNNYGYLHRYIMGKWYTEEVLTEMTNRGWVVDHMNNNGFDCRICNLEFLLSNYNVAKGHVFDKAAKEMKQEVAINIFKDFTEKSYQISLAFNVPVYEVNLDTGERKRIYAVYLLYDFDYRQVINEAEAILLKLKLENDLDLKNLHYKKMEIKYTEQIYLTDKEREEVINGNRTYVMRNQKCYLIADKVKLYSAHYKPGWDKNN